MAEHWFRHADQRVPFLCERAVQPAARWHADGRGPAQYFADTPEGAWAEFLRHEEISDPADVDGIERSLWAVEVELDVETLGVPGLSESTLRGDRGSYPACQAEGDRLRTGGASGLRAPSAALVPGAAGGEIVAAGVLRPAPEREGRTLCLFGARPALRGHRCVEAGSPPAAVLALVSHF